MWWYKVSSWWWEWDIIFLTYHAYDIIDGTGIKEYRDGVATNGKHTRKHFFFFLNVLGYSMVNTAGLWCISRGLRALIMVVVVVIALLLPWFVALLSKMTGAASIVTRLRARSRTLISFLRRARELSTLLGGAIGDSMLLRGRWTITFIMRQSGTEFLTGRRSDGQPILGRWHFGGAPSRALLLLVFLVWQDCLARKQFNR